SHWKNVTYQSLPHKKKFWGFLITALAISMGAPFWFDLIKKLVSLRGAGFNPEEKKAQEKADNKVEEKRKNLGKKIRNTDPVDIVLAENRRKWEAMPGVIAVNKVVEEGGKNVIEIVKEKGINDSSLPGKKIKHEKETLKIKYKNGRYGQFFPGGGSNNSIISRDAEVSSDSESKAKEENIKLNEEWKIESWSIDQTKVKTGRVVGKLRNNDTGKDCILTCGHIISSKGKSMIFEGEEEVGYNIKEKLIYHRKKAPENPEKIKKIGKVDKLIWSNLIDIAVIDLEKNIGEKIPNLDDPINTQGNLRDIEGKPVVFYPSEKESGHKIEARISHVDYSYSFEHEGRYYKRRNLIGLRNDTESDDQKISAVSKKGNSGALVFVKTDSGNYKPLGIIVGGEQPDVPGNRSELSFVLPLRYILKTLNLSIISD
ncbi:MAG: hypothetical protein KDD63_29820, partial [Bacteroidetes bacterium]|nr:hypothetical protein [Bacteroidota bacterium]